MKKKRKITIRLGPLGLSLVAAGITAIGFAAVSLADSGGSTTHATAAARRPSSCRRRPAARRVRRCSAPTSRRRTTRRWMSSVSAWRTTAHRRPADPCRPEQRAAEPSQHSRPGEAAEGVRGLQGQAARGHADRRAAADRHVQVRTAAGRPAEEPKPGPEQRIGHQLERLQLLTKDSSRQVSSNTNGVIPRRPIHPPASGPPRWGPFAAWRQP